VYLFSLLIAQAMVIFRPRSRVVVVVVVASNDEGRMEAFGAVQN